MAMASKTNVHGPATYMMNSGFLLPGFPCMGAWISYGLGNLTDELPTFVVLPDGKGLPYNQKGPFSAGFLPAVNQGTIVNASYPAATVGGNVETSQRIVDVILKALANAVPNRIPERPIWRRSS